MFITTGVGCTCSPRKSRCRSRTEASMLVLRCSRYADQTPRLYLRPDSKTRSNLSRMNTYAKCAANPCRMRTSKSLDLKPRGMNTYEKRGKWWGLIVTQRPDRYDTAIDDPESSWRSDAE